MNELLSQAPQMAQGVSPIGGISTDFKKRKFLKRMRAYCDFLLAESDLSECNVEKITMEQVNRNLFPL